MRFAFNDLRQLNPYRTKVLFRPSQSSCHTSELLTQIMTFPLIREILCALAEVDLLAALTLTETSATLYHFIFGQVVTAPLLCSFLQQNQFALHHDIYGSQFSHHDIALLHRAFEFFRHRENDFYDKTIPFLGPLIAHTPLRAFETSPRIPATVRLQK
jgi:hypothetical protein